MGISTCSAASLPAGVSALLYLLPKQEPASLHVCSFDVFLDVGEPDRMQLSHLPPRRLSVGLGLAAGGGLREGYTPPLCKFPCLSEKG